MELRFSFRGLDIECEVSRESSRGLTPASCSVDVTSVGVEDPSLFVACLPEDMLFSLPSTLSYATDGNPLDHKCPMLIDFVDAVVTYEGDEEISEAAARATR